MSSDNTRLDRDVLRQHGIVYFEFGDILPGNPFGFSSRLPDHVESLRKFLLDAVLPIPDNMRAFYDNDASEAMNVTNDILMANIKPPHQLYVPASTFLTGSKVREVQETLSGIEDNRKLAEAARQHTTTNASKTTWKDFLHLRVFKFSHDTSQLRTQYNYLFDMWYLDRDIEWDEEKLSNKFTRSIPHPPNPKPSFTYGFRMYGPDADLPSGLRDHELISSFSVETLGTFLESEDIVSSPVCGLSEWIKNKSLELNKSQLVCFPWAVVEVDPVEGDENTAKLCYCRAAYAASTALTLLEHVQVCASLGKIVCAEDIPPVIVLTCIGPEIKVWLAFVDPALNIHNVVCIWTSSLNATWGVWFIRQICNRMVFWALRLLRPQISSWIGKIRFSGSHSSGSRSSGSPFLGSYFPLPWHCPQNPSLSHEKKHGRNKLQDDTRETATDRHDNPTQPDRASSSSGPPVTIEKGNNNNVYEPGSSLPSQHGDHQQNADPSATTPGRFSPSSAPRKIPKYYYKGRLIRVSLPPKSAYWKPSQKGPSLPNISVLSVDRSSTRETAPQSTAPIQGQGSSKKSLSLLDIADLSLGGGPSTHGTASKSAVPIQGQDSSKESLSLSHISHPSLHHLRTESQSTTTVHNEDSSKDSSPLPELAHLSVDGDGPSTHETESQSATPIHGQDRFKEGPSLPDIADLSVDDSDTYETAPQSLDSSNTETNPMDAAFTPAPGDTETEGGGTASAAEPKRECINETSATSTSAILTTFNADSLTMQTAKLLLGVEMVNLSVIRDVIGRLTGVRLLDAAWRVFEHWEDKKDALNPKLLKDLGKTLSLLDRAVKLQKEVTIEPILPNDLLEGERWEDLDHSLQLAQYVDEGCLHGVFLAALECWDGGSILTILRPDIERRFPKGYERLRREVIEASRKSFWALTHHPPNDLED